MAELSFERVYADYREKVWKLTSRYVVSSHDREDLFQEVFLKILKALPDFRGDASLDTWIYRITANTAINYLKKQNRYRLLRITLQNLRLVEADDPVEIREELKFAPLEKLNPQQRMIVILHDVEDKKLSEVAEMLNLPEGTVKSSLHRAREIIKKELNGNGEIL